MRATFVLDRLGFLRRKSRRNPFEYRSFFRPCCHSHTPFSASASASFSAHGRRSSRFRWFHFSKAPNSKKVLLASLGPLAFLQLSENQDQEHDATDGKTAEQRMLHASREELKKQVPPQARGVERVVEKLYIFFDLYIYEPLATALRLVHLMVIFIPVIVTVPAIYFGRRRHNRSKKWAGALWWYGFLVSSMEKAGPAFIKLGQWAATRSDIFPQELCSIMSSLHSNVPAHSLVETRTIVERAFDGRSFEDIFEEFDETPLGVGAIAQVYRAKLMADLAVPGDADIVRKPRRFRDVVKKNVDALVKITPQRVPSSFVAIKVLHPKVERLVRRDLVIMGFFASIINAIPTMEWLSLPDEVAKFGEMMRLQLDLRIEAANLTLFRKHFMDRTTAWFPYPYTDYTTRQVLVEEFAQGIPLAVFIENGGGIYQEKIADEGLDAFLRMLVLDNFVHADLHPGNIMVRFYKPEQLQLSLSLRKQDSSNLLPSESDPTEAVLGRLRPYRHHPAEWAAELERLDVEGYRPQLMFVDTGLVTQLNAVNRANFLDLFKAIAEFDGYRAGHLMVERCRQPDAVIEPEIFALKMQHLVLGVKSRTFSLGNIKVGDVLNEVLCMVRSHHVRLEGDFVNVVISILLLEGIGRGLDPELDLFKSALPIMRELGTQQGGTSLLKKLAEGDYSMLKVWVGLEARGLFQVSVESVENCVKYDLLCPNI